MKPQVIGMAARAGNVIESILAKVLPGRDGQADKLLRIISHRSVGDNVCLSVRGRVVRMARSRSGETSFGQKRSASAQLVSVYRAFDVLEVPFVTVNVALNGATASGQSDEAGFFAIELRTANGEGWFAGWHHPTIQIAEDGANRRIMPAHEWGVASEVAGDVFVPPATASLVIVSDLDDTAMDTESLRHFEVVRKVIFASAHKRSPVAGVPDLYRRLQLGVSGENDNPICYISSGAWNLYDHVVDYLDVHRLPKGAVYLNDWGSRGRTFHTVGHSHKSTHVSQLLARFSALPFLFVGDDIFEDPELYAALAERHSHRIVAIWIRVVRNDAARLAEIERLRPALRAAGTELVVAAHSTAFADHARAREWIA